MLCGEWNFKKLISDQICLENFIILLHVEEKSEWITILYVLCWVVMKDAIKLMIVFVYKISKDFEGFDFEMYRRLREQ